MTDLDLYHELRQLVGSPSPDRVSNAQLRSFLQSGLEHIAQPLGYDVRPLTLPLEEDEREFALPENLAQVSWIEWNNIPLEPASPGEWDRGGRGSGWREAPSGTPTEYAIVGRRLLLNPPPDAAAITTDPFLTLRALLSTDPETAPLTLPPHYARLALWQAAIEYCVAHATREDPEGLKEKAAGYAALYKARWQQTLDMARRPDKRHSPRVAVRTYRQGCAR